MNAVRTLFRAGAVLCILIFAVPQALAGTPDPTLLPVATTSQTPMTAAYNSLNVPSMPAGSSYLDPLTGVRVYKLTSASFPASGTSFGHDYAEGGNEISLPLNSSGTRTVQVFTGANHYLIDFTPGVGVSNARSLSATAFAPFLDGCVTFSSNPATPYYMYVSTGATIHRVDVRTMTEATGGGWPVIGETDATWLHQNENDTFFTWMRGANGSTIVGYEPATGTKKTYSNAGLNEPRIDRDANNRYVCVSMGSPQNQAVFWDWRNNTVTWTSPLYPGTQSGEPPVAHQASLRGYWVGVDWNLSYPWQFYQISATPNSIVNPLPGGAAQGGGHCDGNWNQHPASANDQWYACYYYGALAPPSGQGAVAPGGILLSTANGQRRVLAHLYNTSTNYTFYSFAKLAPDGAYVLFTSDMDGSSRSDLFLAEMPSTGGNPPPGDTTPPTVSITAPSGGTTVSGTVTVTANASDNVGVVGVQFMLDGSALGAEDTTSPYSTPWNTTSSVNGNHTLTAIARDAAGNQATSSVVTVNVSNGTPDTTPPTVSITAPTGGATVSGTVTISANASDNVGVVGVQFMLDGAALGAEDTTSPYSTPWDTTHSTNTSHTLTAIARDAAGNHTTSAAITVTVNNPTSDTTPPTIPTGLTATAMSSSQINLSWNASTDSQSGVAGYKIFRNSVQIATATATSYSNTGLAASTTYTYAVSAYDVAGNASTLSPAVNATTQPAPPPPTGGNIMLLHLDEPAGSTLFADASGSNNNGSCSGTGCPTAGVAGKVGHAASFNGSSDFVAVSSNSGLNAFPLTVSTWFKTSSTSGVVGLVNKYVGGSYNGYNVFLNNGNLCAWYLRDTADYTYDGTGCSFNIAGFNDNAWHQVVYVVDATGAKLYVDGLQKGSTIAWTGAAGAPTTTQDIHVGHYPGAFGGVEYFAGSLDEVRIYNFAFSASDVTSLYNADNGPVADTTPPTVSITAPAGGATISNTVTVSANASDNVGVVGVQFMLDGVPLGAEDTSSPFSITWDTTLSSNGAHMLTAIARDAAGNHTSSAAVTVNVSNATADTTPPSVMISAPANGSPVSGTVTVSANATDNVGVVGVQFYLDGAALGAEDTTSPFSVSWDTTGSTNGSHTLTAIARDAAGNHGNSPAVTVTVANPVPDTTPPTVSITAPSGGTSVSGSVTVSANASDNVGVAGVQFYLDGATLHAEDTTSPYSTTWDTTLSANASHTLTAIARDAAGNHTTSAAVTVTVANPTPDTTPPTVPAGLTATVISSSQINLSWNASTDSQSGVAGYKIFRNAVQTGTTSGTTYSNTGLAASTTYSYSVAAYDVAGNLSAQSSSVTATTQAPPPPPPTGGNIMLLHLDEPAGSTLFADSSGSNDNGSCSGTGCPTAGVAGKVGHALSFNGTSDLVDVPSNSGLNAFPLTVSTWFKTSSTSGVEGLVNKYVGGSYNGYNVFLNNGNLCAWYLRDTADYTYDGSGCPFNIAGFNDNAWHQVVYVVDASGGKLYVDGVQKGLTIAWTGASGAPTTIEDVQVGHYPGAFGGVEYFAGSLDEVRIYNIALSATDVSSLYNADNAPAADTTPPTVSVTAPAGGTTISGTVTVSANASDNVGVAGVQFMLDGAALGAEDTSAPFSISWNTTQTANGSHTLTAVARDAAGNQTTSAAVAITVDNPTPATPPPSVTITSPSSGSVVSGSVQVAATATDSATVLGVQFYLDGVALGAESTTPPFAVAWNTSSYTNGNHSLSAIARDAAGNHMSSASVPVDVENNASGYVVTITSPPGGTSVSGKVQISATGWAGTVGVRFYVDGNQIGTEDTFAPFGVTWDTTLTPDGPHALTAVARDLQGHVVTSASVSVTVSNSVRRRPGRH